MTADLVALKLDDTLRLSDDMMNLAQVRRFDGLSSTSTPTIRFDIHWARSPSKTFMKPAVTIAKAASVHNAAKLMVDQETECLAVTEGERLVGIVTRTDLLRELALGAS